MTEMTGYTGRMVLKQSVCQLTLHAYYQGVFNTLFLCTILALCLTLMCSQFTLLLIMSQFARQCVLCGQVQLDVIVQSFPLKFSRNFETFFAFLFDMESRLFFKDFNFNIRQVFLCEKHLPSFTVVFD